MTIANLFKVMAVIVFVLVGIWFLLGCFDASEVVECNQWKEQAKEYPGFWLTKSQNEQCTTHGIMIKTTIK